MSLDEIVEKIIFDRDIHDLLMDIYNGSPLHDSSLKKLVEYQRKTYANPKNKLSLMQEGFQIGEPWNGDISNACVAFISSNPAFNAHGQFPRYRAENKKVFMPNGRALTVADVKQFFEKRFQNAFVTPQGVLQDSGITITYWSCIRNSVATLLKGFKPPIKDQIPMGVKNLMSKAVAMEIVPFKSSGEAGVLEAIPVCLKKFTRHILPHVAAPVIVLVGKKAKLAFLDHIAESVNKWLEAKQAFENKEAYVYAGAPFKGQKLIVSVNYYRGHFSLSSGCSKGTLRELSNIVNAPAKLPDGVVKSSKN